MDNTTKKSNKKKPQGKSAATKSKSTQKKQNDVKQFKNISKNKAFVKNVISPLVFGILAIFCLISLIYPSLCGSLGIGLSRALKGTFGVGCVFFPIFFASLAVFWKKFTENTPILKTISAVLSIIFFTAFMSGVCLGTRSNYTLSQLFEKGVSFVGGGALGGVTSQFMGKYINIFAPFLNFILFVVFLLMTYGITPVVAYEALKNLIVNFNEERQIKRREQAGDEREERYFDDDEDEDEDEPEEFEKEIKRKKKSMPSYTKAEVDAEIELERSMTRRSSQKKASEVYNFDPPGGTADFTEDKLHRTVEEKFLSSPTSEPPVSQSIETKETDEEISEEAAEETPSKEQKSTPFGISYYEQAPKNAPEPTGELGEQLKYSTEEIGDDIPKEEVKHEYIFPPMTLLKEGDNTVVGDISSELKANAKKLSDILESFNVKATVTHISYGPAITRYEIKPAPGIRVASITKLVDDISMSFATMGVRIEAPIPGKEAVGIEVPNKDVSVVRIRDLLDTDTFRNAESKLFCALGKDVVGEPVYLDIAKMPHLLIAGATGMGKSVCINTLITSILYKATPDEVKLILIDPKKVEFVPYSSLPHLLVPVVSDPKKAAGALHWAVSEMERRYDMIESVGVRNIFGYNEITENDPEKERLPQVVIIIDEFADLMMVAKQDVEDSICRLAQKARAAGMHLVIGTQRPSVDVITGLIKANVPSRISCKTSSQIDSRTVLDTAGAEKLMGRGDMLYAPVGIAKPRRVQGAFVSDNEVETVTTFIKKHMGDANYSDTVMETIEKEALNVNNKKASAFSDEDDGEFDELFKPAAEIIFQEGKASTSLLQRNLSIGYGRAAKILDQMQELGICSKSVGNKPRQLLMSKEEFYAMFGDDE